MCAKCIEMYFSYVYLQTVKNTYLVCVNGCVLNVTKVRREFSMTRQTVRRSLFDTHILMIVTIGAAAAAAAGGVCRRRCGVSHRHKHRHAYLTQRLALYICRTHHPTNNHDTHEHV